jgi:uroporphyrinogen-III synthase
MKVWVTRAEPGAGETAKRLTQLGHEALVAPLLTVRRLVEGEPDLRGVGALAFTSANGVRAFAELSARRDLLVFAVGEATAAAARQEGFADIHAGAGDVGALAAEIAGRRGDLGGEVLHAGAAEPAGDLAGALRAAGVPVRALALYQTVAADPLPPAGLDDLTGTQAVLLHSPKAAKLLAEMMRSVAPPLDPDRVQLLGLSPACLAPLADIPAAGRHAAKAPNDADLLALLEGLDPAQDRPRPVLSPLVWTLLALSALCILAGAAVGFSQPTTHDQPPRRPPHLSGPTH